MPCIVYLLPLVLLAGSTSASPACYLAYLLVDLLIHPPCSLCMLACTLILLALLYTGARTVSDEIVYRLLVQTETILGERWTSKADTLHSDRATQEFCRHSLWCIFRSLVAVFVGSS